MRDRKELIYLNIECLTQEEIEALGDMELNCCDNCGEIEQSEKLRWIYSEEFWEDDNCVSLVASGMCALDDDCYEKRNDKLAQCGSCDKFFIAHQDIFTDCPHCHSCNWVYCCIDE